MAALIALSNFFMNLGQLIANPVNILILFGAVIMGILFGATPGLTATLGVALLTTLTYRMEQSTAMIALLAIYVWRILRRDFDKYTGNSSCSGHRP